MEGKSEVRNEGGGLQVLTSMLGSGLFAAAWMTTAVTQLFSPPLSHSPPCGHGAPAWSVWSQWLPGFSNST